MMLKSGLGAGANLPLVIIVGLLATPVFAGLAGTVLPAFGYLPALGAGTLSLAVFQLVFSQPGIWTSLALSLLTGLAATAVSFTVVVVFTAAWSSTRAFDLMRRFLSPLLSVPHAAAAFGLAFLIAPSGFLARLVSPGLTGWDRPPDLLVLNDPYGIAMTAGLVMKEVPFLFLMTVAALNQIDLKAISRSVATLGYGRIRGFAIAAMPQIYAQIRMPILAVLAYSTSVVDVAIILGPTTPAPLAPRILIWLNDPDPALRLQASAGAVLQIGVTVLAIIIWMGLEKIARVWFHSSAKTGRRFAREAGARYTVLSIVAGLVSLTAAGFALLALWSVTRSWWFPDALPSQYTAARWMEVLSSGREVIWATLSIGMAATLVCTGLVLWLLESQTRAQKTPGTALRSFLFLPLIVPQLSFLFGLQVFFVHMRIDGTIAAVVFAHSIFVLPYVFLALSDPWQHLDPRYARIAAAMGASNWKIFLKVRLPMLLTPLLVTVAIGFAVSIGQYLPTVMMGAGRVTTVTTESLALASGGNRSLLAVYAMLQLILPFTMFTLAAAIPGYVFRNRRGMRQGHEL